MLIGWEGGDCWNLGGIVIIDHAVDLLSHEILSRCIWVLTGLRHCRRLLLWLLMLSVDLRCHEGRCNTSWIEVGGVVIALGLRHGLLVGLRRWVEIMVLLLVGVRLKWLCMDSALRYLR